MTKVSISNISYIGPDLVGLRAQFLKPEFTISKLFLTKVLLVVDVDHTKNIDRNRPFTYLPVERRRPTAIPSIFVEQKKTRFITILQITQSVFY